MAATEPQGRPALIQVGPRARMWSWVCYDWGSSAFHSVIVTFVFSTYLTGAVADPEGAISGPTALAITSAVSGFVIALTAPVMGQSSDAGGRRRSLALWTGVVIGATACMVLVAPQPSYLWVGLALFAVGTIAAEFSNVAYYAMLTQVADAQDIGRVSGLGWSMGYAGSILLLLIGYFGFITPDNWFAIPSADGWGVRAVCLLVAVWYAVFALPVLLTLPEPAPREAAGRESGGRAGLADSYRQLVADVVRLWRTDRDVVRFLIASAIYRDGLAAVFTFGAVLAVAVYGMPADMVLIFGVAANLVAALGAAAGGFLEDRLGARAVIMGSLAGLVVSAAVLFLVEGVQLFWVFGLALCLFVGPAQASSRSLLARMSEPAHEGQMFGLYTTSGRAVSFLSPGLFALFAGISGQDRAGIIAIIAVLLVGMAMLTRVPASHGRSAHV